jgi:translocation and assembly module TamA
VRFRGVVGTEEQLLGVSLRRNNFRKRDQVLTANVAASNIDRDAFNARTFLIGAGLERQTNIIWQKRWTWSVGGELLASDERDVNIESGMHAAADLLIAAAPATLSYDGSNDLLDPTRGLRLGGGFSPEASFPGKRLRLHAGAAGRQLLPARFDTVTIAARARLGTIFGADRDRIAPSRRFYAGGGGSVRGYSLQRLGPRDRCSTIRSAGAACRVRAGARVRVGGRSVCRSSMRATSTPPPSPARRAALRGRIGVRYHSNFGPIRVDVGTPLNRRSGDPRVAVYVSLGQAF